MEALSDLIGTNYKYIFFTIFAFYVIGGIVLSYFYFGQVAFSAIACSIVFGGIAYAIFGEIGGILGGVVGLVAGAGGELDKIKKEKKKEEKKARKRAKKMNKKNEKDDAKNT